MLLFRSEEHVDRWCHARDLPRGGVLTPDQGWRLAHGWYKDKLSPDWRRHTLEETEALLGNLGITGDFWNLRGE
jgi:carboxypeptidase C (cathepsin A)